MVIVGPSILVSLAESGSSTTIHDGFLHEFFRWGFYDDYGIRASPTVSQ